MGGYVKKKLLAITSFLIICSSMEVWAFLPGFYGKLQGGYTGKDFKFENFREFKLENFQKEELSGRVALAYQLNTWGLELGYTFHHKADLANTTDWTYKNLLPLSTRLNLYVKASFAWKENMWAPGFGGGFIYYLTPNFSIDLGWTRTFIVDGSWRNFDWSRRRDGYEDAILVAIGFYLS